MNVFNCCACIKILISRNLLLIIIIFTSLISKICLIKLIRKIVLNKIIFTRWTMSLIRLVIIILRNWISSFYKLIILWRIWYTRNILIKRCIIYLRLGIIYSIHISWNVSNLSSWIIFYRIISLRNVSHWYYTIIRCKLSIFRIEIGLVIRWCMFDILGWMRTISWWKIGLKIKIGICGIILMIVIKIHLKNLITVLS